MTLHLSSSPTSSSLVSVVRTTESTKDSCSGVKCSKSSLGLWCLLNMLYPLVTTLWNWVSVYGTCKKCSILWSSFEVFVSYPHTLPLSQNGLHCLLSIQGWFSAIPQPGYAQMHSNPDCLLHCKNSFVDLTKFVNSTNCCNDICMWRLDCCVKITFFALLQQLAL